MHWSKRLKPAAKPSSTLEHMKTSTAHSDDFFSEMSMVFIRSINTDSQRPGRLRRKRCAPAVFNRGALQ
jgi:hypothetical protein